MNKIGISGIFFFLCFCACICLSSVVLSRAPFFVVRPLQVGLFAEFDLVLGVLDHYEKLIKQGQPCAGMRVDFGHGGIYYDPTVGDNFWQYYFEPIELGNKDVGELTEISHDARVHFALIPRYKWSCKHSYRLIQRYIRLKPFMQQKIENFYNKNFKSNYIIGVHYRGTDKVAEAPRVTYKKMYKAILKHISGLKKKRFKIYVASDEEAFIHFIKNKFPGLILTMDLQRSADMRPLHTHVECSKFKIGEGAVLDCLLLSKCNFLIRTSSNLSFAASQFNPRLRCREMNATYYEARRAEKNRRRS